MGVHRAYEQDLCGGLSIAVLFFQHAAAAVRCQDLFLWELLEVSWVFFFLFICYRFISYDKYKFYLFVVCGNLIPTMHFIYNIK